MGSGWEAAVHPADLPHYVEGRRASLAFGEPFEHEVRFRRAANGEYRWFLRRAVPVRDTGEDCQVVRQRILKIAIVLNKSVKNCDSSRPIWPTSIG